jgi:hypothetical protein
MDEQSSRLSKHVNCARCRRAPLDDSDFVDWETLDEGEVCPGCLTMLEEHARRAAK